MLDAHNMNRRRRLKQWYLRLVERGNLNALAGFHFLDDTERTGCDWLQPVRELPALVQPNGLDLDDLARRLDVLPHHALSVAIAERGARHVVFLGRLNVIKGLELQLEVLADVRSAGEPVHLHWIGPDDGEWPKLQALAASLGVTDAIHWHGPIYGDERLRLLQVADAVLLTSHYECNSVMAAETMAVGGALLATDTCHVDQPYSAGAVRVVPRDRRSLGIALLDLLRDEHAAQRLRTRALAFARAELDWQPLAKRMLGFYETLIKGAA
jgi:glycosyltransferase involved in cell wall biosynthesis